MKNKVRKMVTVKKADGSTFQREQLVNADEQQTQAKRQSVAVAPSNTSSFEGEGQQWDSEWEERNRYVMSLVSKEEQAKRFALTNQRILSVEEFDNEVKDYLRAQLWSAGEITDENGEPTLEDWDSKYDITDFDKSTVTQAQEDVAAMLEAAPAAALKHREIAGSNGGLGHDLALTRNGHGTGFWDRGSGDAGERLNKYTDDLQDLHIAVADNGKLILE